MYPSIFHHITVLNSIAEAEFRLFLPVFCYYHTIFIHGTVAVISGSGAQKQNLELEIPFFTPLLVKIEVNFIVIISVFEQYILRALMEK